MRCMLNYICFQPYYETVLWSLYQVFFYALLLDFILCELKLLLGVMLLWLLSQPSLIHYQHPKVSSAG